MADSACFRSRVRCDITPLPAIELYEICLSRSVQWRSRAHFIRSMAGRFALFRPCPWCGKKSRSRHFGLRLLSRVSAARHTTAVSGFEAKSRQVVALEKCAMNLEIYYPATCRFFEFPSCSRFGAPLQPRRPWYPCSTAPPPRRVEMTSPFLLNPLIRGACSRGG